MKKVDLNLISFYGHHAPNNDKGNSYASDQSYTLFYDKKTKGVFKAEAQGMSMPKFLLLFLIAYPTMNFFPNDVIPYHNDFILYSLGLIAIVLSLMVGHYLTQKLNKDVRRITLSKEEWKYYLEKGNKLYFTQITVMTLLLLFAISCIVFLSIFQSKWWLFGGIGTSVVIGTSITIFTKTRYLLYKNKLDVNLNRERKENEDITYW